jgi:hypothetical protein
MLVDRGRDHRENVWYLEVDTEEWQKLCIKKLSTCVWMSTSCISVVRCVNLLMRNSTAMHCFFNIVPSERPVDVAFSEMGSLSLSGLAKAREVSTDHIWRHYTKNNSVQGIPYIFFSLLFLHCRL